jgi:hypothetical protein
MLRKDLEDLHENGQKGDWCFLYDDTQIAVRYGETAFKGTVILPINVVHGWEWDGNKESPTLSPSILVESVPNWNDGWHGFLRAGKLITV